LPPERHEVTHIPVQNKHGEGTRVVFFRKLPRPSWQSIESGVRK
jgi:hypothetical protein